MKSLIKNQEDLTRELRRTQKDAPLIQVLYLLNSKEDRYLCNYEHFFESVLEFKKRQAAQKQRGLNNYNILTSVLSHTDEVRLHSRMIFSLLDIDGDHYQGSLFLEIFLDTLNIKEFTLVADNCSVYKEYQNIDIYITDGYKHIIIENKIDAVDQDAQIKRYLNTVIKENDNLDYQDILVIYLTKEKRKPSKESLVNLEVNDNYITQNNEQLSLYKSIDYRNEILNWLNKCRYEVQNITNLNEAIKQYIDVVKMVNKTYKGKAMNLSDYIMNDRSTYRMAVDVHKAIPLARREIADKFFPSVINKLQIKLGKNWIVKIDGDLSKRYQFPLRIYKKTWKGDCLLFGYEFEKNDYYKGYFGVVRKNDNIPIKPDILDAFKDQIKELNFSLKSTAWWLHWELLPSSGDTFDFSEYVMFEKNAEDEFINKIFMIIDKLEIQSELISNVNKYLESKI